MNVRTTLSFTERHHAFLLRKVEEDVFASASAVVAAAIEGMIEAKIARETALEAMAAEIRARMATPRPSTSRWRSVRSRCARVWPSAGRGAE